MSSPHEVLRLLPKTGEDDLTPTGVTQNSGTNCLRTVFGMSHSCCKMGSHFDHLRRVLWPRTKLSFPAFSIRLSLCEGARPLVKPAEGHGSTQGSHPHAALQSSTAMPRKAVQTAHHIQHVTQLWQAGMRFGPLSRVCGPALCQDNPVADWHIAWICELCSSLTLLTGQRSGADCLRTAPSTSWICGRMS